MCYWGWVFGGGWDGDGENDGEWCEWCEWWIPKQKQMTVSWYAYDIGVAIGYRM